MGRNCEKCGMSIPVGSGKWVGDKNHPENQRIYHKDPQTCDLAPVRIDANKKAGLRLQELNRTHPRGISDASCPVTLSGGKEF